MKALTYLFLSSALLSMLSCTPSASKSSTGSDTEQTVNEEKNTVVETIMSRRSIRKYKPLKVESEKLDEILKCGINAPNGMGRQSWEIRVVESPEVIAEIDSLNKKLSADSGMEISKLKHVSYGAPVLIFIANDTTYDLSQVDCGLLGANIILSSQSMGLGTCCLGGIVRMMNSPAAKSLLDKLDLPENYNLLYAIALGYPNESPKAKPRNAGKIKFIGTFKSESL